VVNIRFVTAGGVMLFVIAALLAFSFLIGTVTSSTAVSIMTSYAMVLFSIILYVAHGRLEAVLSSNWQVVTINTFYWIVPKAWELGTAVAAYVSGPSGPIHITETIPLSAFLSTAAFGVGSLILAVWRFQKKEF